MRDMPAEMQSFRPQQREVYGHLILGKSEKDIADALNVSIHTVHAYIKAIYKAFGVGSKPQLLSLLVQERDRQIARLEARLQTLGYSEPVEAATDTL